MNINLGDQSVWQSEGLEYLRYEYDIAPGELVLDIGSYRKEFGEVFEAKGCKVEYFDAMDNRAAWLFDGELKMGGQYYYTSMFDEGELGKVHTYKCVDIATYLQSQVALCKINIEGGEYELLNYIIRKGLHLNIKHLQVQFHLVEGMPSEGLYMDIAKKLSVSHNLKWRFAYVWESWERVY